MQNSLWLLICHQTTMQTPEPRHSFHPKTFARTGKPLISAIAPSHMHRSAPSSRAPPYSLGHFFPSAKTELNTRLQTSELWNNLQRQSHDMVATTFWNCRDNLEQKKAIRPSWNTSLLLRTRPYTFKTKSWSDKIMMTRSNRVKHVTTESTIRPIHDHVQWTCIKSLHFEQLSFFKMTSTGKSLHFEFIAQFWKVTALSPLESRYIFTQDHRKNYLEVDAF